MRAHVPEPLRYQPFELLLAFMCLVSGTSTLLGAPNERSAVVRVLPEWFLHSWALVLVLGGLALICGASSAVQLDGRVIIRRIACYRFGLRLLGAASLIYGATLFIAAGLAAFTVAPIVLAFSLACYVRHADITARSKVLNE